MGGKEEETEGGGEWMNKTEETLLLCVGMVIHFLFFYICCWYVVLFCFDNKSIYTIFYIGVLLCDATESFELHVWFIKNKSKKKKNRIIIMFDIFSFNGKHKQILRHFHFLLFFDNFYLIRRSTFSNTPNVSEMNRLYIQVAEVKKKWFKMM